MTTSPLMACSAKAGTPSAYMDVVMACMTKAPMQAGQQREPSAGPQHGAADDHRQDGIQLVGQCRCCWRPRS